jgi:hypothetical protein
MTPCVKIVRFSAVAPPLDLERVLGDGSDGAPGPLDEPSAEAPAYVTPRCSCCGGCYHEATGHYVSPTHRWCGPCTRDFVAFLRGHLRRSWAQTRFYDHAYSADEAVRRREAALLA